MFWILFYLWVITEVLFGIRARRLQRGQPKKQNHDRGSVFLIMIGMYVLILISFIFSVQKLGELPNWIKYAGYILMVVGMVIRYAAIIQLGRFFSPVVGVVTDQEIVHSGLYRWIRHPSYTGGWLTAIGIGLGLQTWWGVVFCGVGLLLIYVYRIRIEERALIQHFGEKYLNYIRSTKKMFPGIW
ncbi:methyltransferase family protein [Alicyclobacillus mengziensis]|uniref:Isoprenylcysteine carboxylmethyltransferase family protein n=1 Tax=Alicyclobacillus mengziensis TaxID=2931921 RepID=A0A9X7Z5X1_9BACL|nr:isoprenylcysteine carboxylmethyltransferase family protein [Alicyclobacillus mengziensis]QSO47344.1 isoprenylcysteine carboxylmethyltransferase family protein [Alicyclobacillus mengziensis]